MITIAIFLSIAIIISIVLIITAPGNQKEIPDPSTEIVFCEPKKAGCQNQRPPGPEGSPQAREDCKIDGNAQIPSDSMNLEIDVHRVSQERRFIDFKFDPPLFTALCKEMSTEAIRVVIVPGLSQENQGDAPFEVSPFVATLRNRLEEAGVYVVVVDAEREQV